MRVLPALLQQTQRSALLQPRAAPVQLSANALFSKSSTGFNSFLSGDQLLRSDQLLGFFAHFFFEPGVRFVLIAAGCILCTGVTLTILNTALFFVNKAVGTRFRALLDFWPCDECRSNRDGCLRQHSSNRDGRLGWHSERLFVSQLSTGARTPCSSRG